MELGTKNSVRDEMLKKLALGVSYTDGNGDWLFYTNNGNKIKVLDVVGSYGINLLGHKNKYITSLYSTAIKALPPAFIQGSINPSRKKISIEINQHLNKETGKSNWICEFANTGSETVEIALKICFLNYFKRVEKVKQELYYSLNYINNNKLNIATLNEKEIKSYLVDLEKNVFIINFEGSFHGKSLGTLSLTESNNKVKFPVATQKLTSKTNADDLLNLVQAYEITYRIIHPGTHKIKEQKFLPVASIILEPIQGESGIHPMPKNLIETIFDIKLRCNVPVISDEIQSGLYRTGYFASLHASNKIADVYCFSKAMGGGVVKLGAVACSTNIYDASFYKYHSTTFGEDQNSLFIGNKVLKYLSKNEPIIKHLKQNKIYNELYNLLQDFPEIIKDVRGRGNMLAIELNEDAIHTSFVSKFFKDLGLLGYWVSSVLLNRERIRIFPTLSSPLSFRIQPSIFFNEEELSFLIKGLRNFCRSIKNKNLPYLFGHIMPVKNNTELKKIPWQVQKNVFPENAAVFLCHPIDIPHVRRIVDLTDGFDDEQLNELLTDVADNQEFTVYHVDELYNSRGKKIPTVFLGIPLTSQSFYHAIRHGKRNTWIAKIQKAIDWSNQKNAISIGLGQFTSIITNNGQFLNPGKAQLTTGNAYTASLAIQATEKASMDLGKALESSHICLVGAGGNIISAICQIFAEKARQMTLVYRNNYMDCDKTKLKLITLLKLILKNPDSTISKVLRKEIDLNRLSLKNDLNRVLELPAIKNHLVITHNLSKIRGADIVVIGTNSTDTILKSHHLKQNAIIVDIAVPANTSTAVRNRNDIKYIKGGIAGLPIINQKEQHLNSVILPFGKGESYGCMAETFGLAFNNKNNKHYIGDITKKDIEEVTHIMQNQGFSLKRAKVESSI